MSRLGILGIPVLATLLVVSPVGGQEAPDSADGTNLTRVLREPIACKDFVTPMTLKDAIGLLYEQFASKGRDLPILVDEGAFRDAAPEDVSSIYDTMVSVHPLPRTLRCEQVLEAFLSTSKVKASYLVKNDAIVIVPEKQTRAAFMVKQRVNVSFDRRPLKEALRELSNRTGATIVLDPVLSEKAATPVTANFRPGATLLDALLMLSDMAEMRPAVLANSIYITTPSNAKALETESRRQAESLDE